MQNTRVQSDNKHMPYAGHMTNVIKLQSESIDYNEADSPQTLTKIMFWGLTLTSMLLFYLAISSLML